MRTPRRLWRVALDRVRAVLLVLGGVVPAGCGRVGEDGKRPSHHRHPPDHRRSDDSSRTRRSPGRLLARVAAPLRESRNRSAPAKPAAPTIRTQPSGVTPEGGVQGSVRRRRSWLPAPRIQWKESSNGKRWTAIAGRDVADVSLRRLFEEERLQVRGDLRELRRNDDVRAVNLKVLFAPVVTTNRLQRWPWPGATATFRAAASGVPAPSVNGRSPRTEPRGRK